MCFLQKSWYFFFKVGLFAISFLKKEWLWSNIPLISCWDLRWIATDKMHIVYCHFLLQGVKVRDCPRIENWDWLHSVKEKKDIVNDDLTHTRPCLLGVPKGVKQVKDTLYVVIFRQCLWCKLQLRLSTLLFPNYLSERVFFGWFSLFFSNIFHFWFFSCFSVFQFVYVFVW